MSTPQNTKAYIQMPINQKPENDGWYLPCDPMGYVEERKIQLLEGEWNFLAESDTFYLKPIDLSRMLEETWDAGQLRRQQEMWHENYDPTGTPEAPDLEAYLNSILNPK